MRAVLFGILFFTLNSIMAQEFRTDISYKYMFANKWDKAIQTYNFSRPFLEEKQPLLIHGLNASVAYIFKSSKSLQHGIDLSYSYFRSSAENEKLNNILNLHFLNLGYIIHYHNIEKAKGLYTDLIISAVSSGLYRNVNDEPFEYDDSRSKAFGIGGDLSIRAGYYINLKNKIYLSPFVLVGYTPFLYSPNSEAVINQTKGLVGNNFTGILSTHVGLTFDIRHQKKD
jgi:hypothetical protein